MLERQTHAPLSQTASSHGLQDGRASGQHAFVATHAPLSQRFWSGQHSSSGAMHVPSWQRYSSRQHWARGTHEPSSHTFSYVGQQLVFMMQSPPHGFSLEQHAPAAAHLPSAQQCPPPASHSGSKEHTTPKFGRLRRFFLRFPSAWSCPCRFAAAS